MKKNIKSLFKFFLLLYIVGTMLGLAIWFVVPFTLGLANGGKVSPATAQESIPAEPGSVLSDTGLGPQVINFNVETVFKSPVTMSSLTVENDFTAPNVIYSVISGTGIAVTAGQNPVISNTGVLSLNGQTGVVGLTGGSGVSINGTQITNTGILSLSAGDGISVDGNKISNSDRGSSQSIFKTFAVDGQESINASSNSDTLRLIEGTGIILVTDPDTKSITLSANAADSGIATGWDHNTLTGSVYLQTITDNVGIGTNTPLYKLHVVGTGYISGASTFGSTLNVIGMSTLNGIDNQSGGISNAGSITGATGFTSTGTITLGSMSTGILHTDSSGVVTSSPVALDGGATEIIGTLPTTLGGTGLTSYTTGDMIYASGTNTLVTLPIGGDGEILTVAGGVPTWASFGGSGGVCPDCLISDPNSTQAIIPTSATATGLSVRKAAGGTVDIFNVTSNDGATKFFRVDSAGSIILGSQTSSGVFTVSPAGTDPISISPGAQGAAAFTGTITSADLTAARTYTLPDASGTFCLTTGNCTGSSAGLGGAGTANYVARFNSSYVLENSSIYDNGNVGIGTTVPGSKLAVTGTFNATGASTFGSTVGVTGATTLSSTLGVSGATTLSSTLGVTGNTTVGGTLGVTGLVTLSGNLNVNGAGNSYFNGNVGIGSTLPTAKLDVAGAIYQIGTSSYTGYMRTNSSQTGNTTVLNPGLLVYGGDGINPMYGIDMGYNSSAQVGGAYRTRVFTGSGKDIAFGTWNTATPTLQTDFTERMTLNSVGNLGIGSVNPTQKLDVNGNVKATTFIQNGSVVCDTSGNCTGSSAGIGGSGTTNYIPKFTGTYTIGNSLIYDNGTNVGIGTNTPSQLLQVGTSLYVNNTSTRVGIGSTSPGTTLDVTGIIRSSSSYNLTAGTALNQVSGYLVVGAGYTGSYTPTGLTLGAGTGGANTNGSMFQSTSSSTTASNAAGYFTQTGATTGTDYGVYVTNTGAATTNVGGYFTASGGTNNYAGIFEQGNVGIGTTSPGNKLSLNAPTTADSLADMMIGVSATTQKGLVIQGKASQTANLLELQSSTGTNLFSVNKDGTFIKFAAPTGYTYTPAIANDVTNGIFDLDYNGQVSPVDTTKVGYLFRMGQNKMSFYMHPIGSSTLDERLSMGPRGNGMQVNTYLGIRNINNDGTTNLAFTISDSGATYQMFRVQNYTSAVGQIPNNVGVAPGTLTIYGSATGTPTLISRAIASQTADIFQAQDSSGNPLSVINSAGNVGIGTTAPVYKLDVAGTLRSTSTVNFSGLGTGGTTHLCLDGSTNVTTCAATSSLTGSGTANYVARWTSTSALSTGVLYDNATNVGIGTATPGYKLDVNGTTNVGGSLYVNAALALVRNVNELQVQGNTSLGLYTNSLVRATIDTNGNMGIGSTAPSQKLDVNGTAAATSFVASNTGLIKFNGRSSLQSATDGNLLLTNNAGTNFSLLQFGGTTSSFPALRRVGVELQVRLADDSAFADLHANSATFNGDISANGDGSFTNVYANNEVQWGGAGARLSSDQGGSIELGPLLGSGDTPFIDFHYGSGSNDDFNVRVTNSSNNTLSTIDSAGNSLMILSGDSVSAGTQGAIDTFTGAYLSDSGVWTDNSSRTLKENFTSLDSATLLSKIDQLGITEWNYKVDKDGTKHIGPVAEDFYSIFGVGNDNKHIAAIDSAGIALAGVKAVNEKLNGFWDTSLGIQTTQNNKISDLSNIITASITPVATQSAQLSGVLASITSLTAKTDENATKLSAVEDSLKELNSKVSSLSAVLGTESNIEGLSKEATLSALLVSGKANINELSVIGTISNGLLSVDGVAGTIDVLASPLKLQSQATAGIEFVGNLASIDTTGNFKAESITTKKLNIDSADQSSASAGKTVLEAGQTSKVIVTSAVTADSLIFITPKTKTTVPMSVTSQINGTSFTVEVDSAQGKNIEFNWIVVN